MLSLNLTLKEEAKVTVTMAMHFPDKIFKCSDLEEIWFLGLK